MVVLSARLVLIASVRGVRQEIRDDVVGRR